MVGLGCVCVGGGGGDKGHVGVLYNVPFSEVCVRVHVCVYMCMCICVYMCVRVHSCAEKPLLVMSP